MDPRFPTNRAVLVLLPLTALLGAAAAVYRADEPLPATAVIVSGLMFALVAFGAWALTRELAPDDDAAAFVAMVLGIAQLFAGADSVLLVFVALGLVRVVNRTTGLAARPLDSLLVAGFTIWATVSQAQPWLGLAGMLAFVADALLPDGRRWQFLPAAACFAATVVSVTGETAGLPGAAPLALVIVIAAAYLAAVWRTRPVVSVGDVYGHPLDALRVQAGMLVGLSVALQAVASEGAAALTGSTIWASIVAVPAAAAALGLSVRKS